MTYWKKNGAELYEDNIVLCNASGNAPGNICRYTLATFKDSAARPRYSWRARDVYLFSLYRNMNVRKIKTPQTVTHGALIYGGSGVSGYALRKKNSLQNCAMTQHMLFSAWGVTLPPVNRASRYRPLSARTPISVPLAVSHLRVLGGRFLWFLFFRNTACCSETSWPRHTWVVRSVYSSRAWWFLRKAYFATSCAQGGFVLPPDLAGHMYRELIQGVWLLSLVSPNKFLLGHGLL